MRNGNGKVRTSHNTYYYGLRKCDYFCGYDIPGRLKIITKSAAEMQSKFLHCKHWRVYVRLSSCCFVSISDDLAIECVEGGLK